MTGHRLCSFPDWANRRRCWYIPKRPRSKGVAGRTGCVVGGISEAHHSGHVHLQRHLNVAPLWIPLYRATGLTTSAPSWRKVSGPYLSVHIARRCHPVVGQVLFGAKIGDVAPPRETVGQGQGVSLKVQRVKLFDLTPSPSSELARTPGNRCTRFEQSFSVPPGPATTCENMPRPCNRRFVGVGL